MVTVLNSWTIMKNIINILLLSVTFLLGACESAEDISFGFDHSVPEIVFENDSVTVSPGSGLALNLKIMDNVGVASWELSYPNWNFRKFGKVEGVKECGLSETIVIPDDAKLEWEEVKYRNDGSTYIATEIYHRIVVVATDVNLNKRTSYLYVRIRQN